MTKRDMASGDFVRVNGQTGVIVKTNVTSDDCIFGHLIQIDGKTTVLPESSLEPVEMKMVNSFEDLAGSHYLTNAYWEQLKNGEISLGELKNDPMFVAIMQEAEFTYYSTFKGMAKRETRGKDISRFLRALLTHFVNMLLKTNYTISRTIDIDEPKAAGPDHSAFVVRYNPHPMKVDEQMQKIVKEMCGPMIPNAARPCYIKEDGRHVHNPRNGDKGQCVCGETMVFPPPTGIDIAMADFAEEIKNASITWVYGDPKPHPVAAADKAEEVRKNVISGIVKNVIDSKFKQTIGVCKSFDEPPINSTRYYEWLRKEWPGVVADYYGGKAKDVESSEVIINPLTDKAVEFANEFIRTMDVIANEYVQVQPECTCKSLLHGHENGCKLASK